MIKKIAKISLVAVAIASISLCAIKLSFTLSAKSLYESVVTMGTLVPQKNTNTLNKAHVTEPNVPPIDLPPSWELPYALAYLKSKNDQQGQVPENPPSDEQSDENNDDNEQFPPLNNHPVLSLDMSDNQTENNITYKNESRYSPDPNALAKGEYPLKYSHPAAVGAEPEPLVLIIHTHGTECYLADGQTEYTDQTPTRSTDKSINVVGIGEIFAKTLNENGIPTIHCDIMFDKDSYSQSYDLSEKAVIEYIEKYPSIQYVFDIHRDSIIKENMDKIKPVTTINDVLTAQAMFVVGTDSSGAHHPNWTDNLTVASFFQKALIKNHGNIMRPINIRAASFNAEHATGSILIEIGTCGNTVSEAKNCAVLLATTIANVILNDGIK